MLKTSDVLYAIYVEGETKTGKGAASLAIADDLKKHSIAVYYDVAGDFFRRYVAIVRRELRLSEDDDLPSRAELERIASTLYANGKAFSLDPMLGDLQRPSISRSVSLLGELPVAQAAAVDWYKQSVKQAVQSGAEVMILDGRNPRRHVEQHVSLPGVEVRTILDIYMTCDAIVAARRVLESEASGRPTEDQLKSTAQTIEQRRSLDRQRAEWPFWWPEINQTFKPGEQAVREVIMAMWQDRKSAMSPLPVVIDNSIIPKTIMLSTVADLANAALLEIGAAV